MEKDDKNHKSEMPPQDAKKASANEAAVTTNASAKSVDLSKEAWEQSKRPWRESFAGRTTIRLLSRGILGAVAFQTGGMMVRKQLSSHRYLPYQPHYTLKEQMFGKELEEGVRYGGNPLKTIAKLIDEGVGKPTYHIAEFLGMEALEARKLVSFRPTAKAGYMYAGKEFANIRGRSLGHETVAVTFDFFSASVADAFGRDIADALDPTIKTKPWRDEKGNFSIDTLVNNAAKKVFRYVTYNGGEDWAVGIPYAFLMKGQRYLINELSPGFMYDSDHQLHGGSFKVNSKGEVQGSFLKEGILDLQLRFTAYNIGTLMFREMYDKIEQKIKYGNDVYLYGAPDKERPDRTMSDRVSDLTKWVARSAVKASIYMSPSVPFFWLFRSTQARRGGVIVNIEHDPPSMLAYKMPGGKRNAVPYGHFYKSALSGSEMTPVYFSTFRPDYTDRINTAYERGQEIPAIKVHPGVQGVHPFKSGRTTFDKTFDWFARLNHNVSQSLDGVAFKLDKMADGGNKYALGARDFLGLYQRTGPNKRQPHSFTRFTRPMINAAVAYTPYMVAKAEFADKWDDGKMDLAVERLVDGAAGLNWKEFKAGLGEITNKITNKPFDDPERDAEGERRIVVDTSLADDAFRPTREVYHKSDPTTPGYKRPQTLSWRERVISRNGDKDEAQSVATKHTPKSHSEREEMRKLLEEITPPTNSLH